MEQDSRLYLVAKMYYIDQMKQNEIADALQIQTMTVSRLLRKAEQEEIVTFHVREPDQINWKLGKQLKKKYPDMKEIIAVDVHDGQDARRMIGKAAAFYVKGILKGDSVVGISWGQVIQRFTEALPSMELPGARVLQMSGGFLCEENESMMPYNLVKSVSERLHCPSVFLNAPLMVATSQIKASLMEDPLLKYAESLSGKLDIAIYGLSPLGREATMSSVGALSPACYEELRQCGAVGDVMGYFIDAGGRLVDWSRRDCYMGTSIQEAAKAPNAVCLATGMEKQRMLDLALRGHYCNTLVVASDLAKALLDEEG